jgi:hypothetical protein
MKSDAEGLHIHIKDKKELAEDLQPCSQRNLVGDEL